MAKKILKSDKIKSEMEDLKEQLKEAKRRERQQAAARITKAAERVGLVRFILEEQLDNRALEEQLRKVMQDTGPGAAETGPAAPGADSEEVTHD